jgi:hypothetical protein
MKPTDETDHQYHLPSQAAAADIGVSDRDTGCWLACGWASGCTTAVLMGTTVDSGWGSAIGLVPGLENLAILRFDRLMRGFKSDL